MNRDNISRLNLLSLNIKKMDNTEETIDPTEQEMEGKNQVPDFEDMDEDTADDM